MASRNWKRRANRKATFDPKIVAKGQTRWTGFDDKIISMYARGMTTREIQGHLEEMYGIEVSPTLISNVTEAVLGLSTVDAATASQPSTLRGRLNGSHVPPLLARSDSRCAAETRADSNGLQSGRRQENNG